MRVIGLTGGIASGKSFCVTRLAQMHIPIFNADKVVHELYAKSQEVIAFITSHYPDAIVSGVVDRKKLGEIFFNDPKAKKHIADFLHPRIELKLEQFLRYWAKKRVPMVVVEVPLLFEAGYDQYCDVILMTHAPYRIRRIRALKRANMDESRFESICKQQVFDHKKRKKVDFVINTGLSKHETQRQLMGIIRNILDA